MQALNYANTFPTLISKLKLKLTNISDQPENIHLLKCSACLVIIPVFWNSLFQKAKLVPDIRANLLQHGQWSLEEATGDVQKSLIFQKPVTEIHQLGPLCGSTECSLGRCDHTLFLTVTYRVSFPKQPTAFVILRTLQCATMMLQWSSSWKPQTWGFFSSITSIAEEALGVTHRPQCSWGLSLTVRKKTLVDSDLFSVNKVERCWLTWHRLHTQWTTHTWQEDRESRTEAEVQTTHYSSAS